MAKEIKYNTEARELLKEGVDALAATRAAGEDGIIPGGGVAYILSLIHI